MPLKAYIGLPRAGKSYEVVVNVILAALRQGRRVVSNIAGLNYEAMCQILYQEGYSQDKIGSLVCIEHDQVASSFFWRTDTDAQFETESFIQPGDLVALDEIWRFWKKRGDIHPRAMNFFRMHGHMTHPKTGLTCEIALITQSIRDINENIKDVIQETYQMVKNSKLGSDKSYIVHIFQRGSTSKSDFIRTLPPRFYDAKYFPLYKSHSQHKEGDAVAQEKNPDDRGNILKGALFKVGLPIAAVMFCGGAYMLWRFLHPVNPQQDSKPATQASVVTAAPAVAPSPKQTDNVAHDWRVVGYFQTSAGLTFTLADATNKIRYLVNPPNYKLSAMEAEVVLPDGSIATQWGLANEKSLLHP